MSWATARCLPAVYGQRLHRSTGSQARRSLAGLVGSISCACGLHLSRYHFNQLYPKVSGCLGVQLSDG